VENDTFFCGEKSRHCFFHCITKTPPHTFSMFLLELTSSKQHLGFLNCTNDVDPSNHHAFSVLNSMYFKIKCSTILTIDNRVGVDANSLISLAAYKAGCWLDDDRATIMHDTFGSLHSLALSFLFFFLFFL
jgi:hypothetical protein